MHLPSKHPAIALSDAPDNSHPEGTDAETHRSLFRAIADLTAVAVANILTNEEMLEREREKQQLLLISNDLANVRVREDFWPVLNHRIARVFGESDTATLYFLKPDGKLFYGAQYKHESFVLTHGSLLSAMRADGSLPVEGTPFEEILAAEGVFTRSVGQWSERYPDFWGLELCRLLSITELILSPLRYQGKTVGCWLLGSTTGYSNQEKFLHKAVTDQLSVAVANILANEEIIEREREKTQLLAISQAIAAVQEPGQLLRVVYQTIRPVFPFADAGLFVPDKDGTHRDLLVDEQVLNDPAAVALVTQQLGGKLPAHEAVEYFMAHGPVQEPLATLYGRFPGHPHYPAIQAVGYAHVLGGPLRQGGQRIGMLCFFPQPGTTYGAADLILFRGITDQVAVAVANILAHREIREREREKAILLSISEQLARVRNKEELLAVMLENLKPIFGFEEPVISLYDPGMEYVQHHNLARGEKLESPFYRQLVCRKVSLQDSPHQEFITYPGPRIIDFDHFGRTYPEHPGIKVMQQLGLVQSCIMPLRQQERLLGMLEFHARRKDQLGKHQLSLYRILADQVAVAVANILASEEILEREREKSLHLSVTTALTSQADLAGKFGQVAGLIGQVIPWDVCSILLPHKPHLGLTWRATDRGAPEQLLPDRIIRELGISPMELQSLSAQTSPLSQEAALYTGAAFEQIRQSYGLVGLAHQHWGIQSNIYLPVRINGNLSALLILASRRADFYQPAQLALLQRLAVPMALALENIFSFEQLQQREEEKTRQLALDQVLVSIKDSRRLYQAIARELDEVVRFDLMSVRVIRAQKLLSYQLVSKADGRFGDATESVKAATPTLEEMELGQANGHAERAAVYTGEAFDERCGRLPLYRLRRDQYGVRSTIEIPLPVPADQRAVLVLSSRAPYAFTAGDLARLMQFIPSVTLAVENLLAFEEINDLRKRVEQEKTYLVEEIKVTHNFEEIISTGPAMQRVFRQVSQVAPTGTTVLVLGESGTGKELIARAIHNRSPRKDRVLVKLNCAALPPQLIESELFGHEKGAFTGAIERRIGKFELAAGGTIFLDEIGEMPPELQAKLLRVLQEKEFERLGSNKVHRADVRVIAATNRALNREVAEGRFRMDLYYRLNVFPITLPPLRDRREDIPLLAEYFGRKFSRKMGRPFPGISESAMRELLQYAWPGNIRELENLVEQAVIINEGGTPLYWARSLGRHSGGNAARAATPAIGAPTLDDFDQRQAQALRDYLLEILKQTGGRIRGKGGAAELLNVKPTTLESRLVRMGIAKEHALRNGD